MKREFLQNLKVNDQPLPKEVIDAIMAENGRDIEAAKKPFGDYDTIKRQLEDARTTIKGFEDQDIDGVRKAAQDWEKKYNDAIAAHQQELADRDFSQLLETAITGFKGKNAKAITALLDVEVLRGSEDQQKAINAALEALKKDSGYLFDGEGTPPPYARGTGTGTPPAGAASSLADALREKYSK